MTLFSEGLQASDVRLSKSNLADPPQLQALVDQLAKAGLLPVNLKGASLQITDPAVGAKLTAAQAHGVLQFWQDYAAAAGMTLR